ncbi:energy transducer TonB family protein [Tenacibaculum soleae]|uniref:energy transducer TonB family protein n=1 Tax=Tenacibaculum soleae TaxID=447689 RepID=UPI0023019542|nr:energy transducer TonB [Tenacibaculum soleae]
MQVLETTHKRKSAVVTAIILLLLLLGIFNFGMQYLDPPIEYGIVVNFGNSDIGSGEPVEETKFDTSIAEEVKEEVTKEEVVEADKEEIKEDIITDNSNKDISVVKKLSEQKKVVKEVVKKEKVKEKPKPSKQVADAFNSLLNGTSDKGTTQGEGDDKKQGAKGTKKGDPDSNKYYGNSGNGSDGNYNLAGRKALSKPIKKPDCQEEGIIVVSIEVNQKGEVTKAQTGGIKGSTSSAPCLEKAAKEAAMKTKWNAATNAPKKQRGTIIYKFSLSK